MKRTILLGLLMGICALQISSQPPQYPDFNGTWLLQSAGSHEVHVFHHDGKQVHVVQEIDDSLGKRTVEFSIPIDGSENHVKVLGDPFMARAQWFGDSLIWETRRERSIGIFYNRRIMKLAGRDEIRALRTRFLPGPEESWDEVWLRQRER